jgi:hypothetical protein
MRDTSFFETHTIIQGDEWVEVALTYQEEDIVVD